MAGKFQGDDKIMATFPTIALPSSIENETWKAQIKSGFENGAMQSRARFTSGKEKFRLSWIRMTKSDFAILKTFFLANIGNSFSWNDADMGETYTVIFSQDKIIGRRSPRAPGYLNVEISLEEA